MTAGSRRAIEKSVLNKFARSSRFRCFSPLAKGGAGGVATARSVRRSSHALSLSVLSHPSSEVGRVVFDFQGFRPHPPGPPFARGGKGSVARAVVRSAQQKHASQTVPPVRSTPTFHRLSLTQVVVHGDRVASREEIALWFVLQCEWGRIVTVVFQQEKETIMIMIHQNTLRGIVAVSPLSPAVVVNRAC